MKVLERFCLLLWIVSLTASISFFGLGLFMFLVNLSSSSFHWTEIQIDQRFMGFSSTYLMWIGGLMIPISIFQWTFGVKYLHFREHDDGVYYDDEV